MQVKEPESSLNIWKRLWIYQKERFPVFAYSCMILAFTFSAASYSLICRGQSTFISIPVFITGALTSFGFFFLLRVFDEFKDAPEDREYRPYRPVPRGLVSLKEVGYAGIITVAIQVSLNLLIAPHMLWAFLIPLFYMVLMAKEFFVPKWLKARPILYMLSHMAIMPLIDIYTTGLDWISAKVSPPGGLIYFLLVTFLNGIVIEIGRKIRAPQDEEKGVETYSALYGHKRATILWLFILGITAMVAYVAAHHVGYGYSSVFVFLVLVIITAVPGFLFLKTTHKKWAKHIETMSGIWTIGMYLTLGGIPMIMRYL